MSKNLVIIESPGKKKTLSKILGPEYEIVASFGHCVDLPANKFSVNIKKDFEPTFEILPDKKDVIKELKSKAKKAKKIYLSTDLDREGAAIAYHLYDILKDVTHVPILRASFTQITKDAVLNAIQNASDINVDHSLVEAQFARRILDRVCGYRTSFLTKQATGGSSAGRVQSVALRLLAEREKEIKNFVPEEYWEITASLLSPKNESFQAKLDGKVKIRNEEEASKIYDLVKKGSPVVKLVDSKEIEIKPYPPFVTQSLTVAAKSSFGWANSKTMKIAQDLYEGCGSEKASITYMRTDSYFINPEVVSELRNVISNKFGSNYLPEKPNFYKNKASAQAGHEACRPVDVSILTTQGGDHLKLYELIWKRTAGSQSIPSKEKKIRVIVDISNYDFIANGSSVTFDGWKKIYDYVKSEDVLLPDLQKGDKCRWNV